MDILMSVLLGIVVAGFLLTLTGTTKPTIQRGAVLRAAIFITLFLIGSTIAGIVT